jgi:hypothetical protein
MGYECPQSALFDLRSLLAHHSPDTSGRRWEGFEMKQCGFFIMLQNALERSYEL